MDRTAVQALPPCTCSRLRRAARRATRIYDRHLAPAGIGAAQFGVLVAVAGRDGASLTELAQSLDMDRTTLTRNLRPLERAGHLRLAAGADKRSRAVGITAEGRAVLARARPLWRNAQRVVAESLGAGDLAALHSLLEITLARLPAD